MNISLLDNTFSSQPGHIGNCLFRPKPIRISKFADKNVSLMGGLNMVKKGSEDLVEIDSSTCYQCLVLRKIPYNNLPSIGRAFNKKIDNFIPIGKGSEKGNGNLMPIDPNYYRSNETFVAMDSFYNKANEAYMSAGPTYDNGRIDIASITSIQGQQDATVASLGTVYSKGNSSFLSMSQSHNKGNDTTIPYGGFHDNLLASYPSFMLISNRSPLLNHSSAQPSGALQPKDFAKYQNINSVSACTSWRGSGPKNKEKKTNVHSNNFPSNVKILLSTGIFEGVPVKYVSWSREKNLPGAVKGTGYLCGCNDCKLSKTKHPNTHIYFENGKSIYAVVQELKSTPRDMLFATIENVTGSLVNQKNLHTWTADVRAAGVRDLTLLGTLDIDTER
ncbi:unnamed protein product [Fraxinus pennsylvanica]|uniref:Uncharacterized protein n=1 Tax=Fraxinus pennsylvanica TaxID=56036 RepID=A0AAD1YQ12_9LAMI|nr:unnamed protein product [Fraxinus pennsylvanica]